MIERLRLKNFQCHERSDLDLDQVTTVVGPTDTGKSAFLRALRWLVTNRPSGSAFIREGADEAAVRVDVDGRVVERRKGKKRNHYRIDRSVMKAVGTSVPDQVSDLLNLTELNFQSQMDPPFWFFESPASVSKQLNEIISLDSIDRALKNANSLKLKASTRVTVAQERLDAATTQLEQLKRVPSATRAFRRVEKAEKSAHSVLRCAALCRTLTKKGVKLRGFVKSAGRASTEIVKTLDVGRQAQQLHERAEVLRESLTRAATLETEIKRHRRGIKAVEQKLKEFKLCPTCKRPME